MNYDDFNVEDEFEQDEDLETFEALIRYLRSLPQSSKKMRL